METAYLRTRIGLGPELPMRYLNFSALTLRDGSDASQTPQVLSRL